MDTNDTNEVKKDKKKSRHIILGKPILGGILLMLWGFFICYLVVSSIGSQLNNTTINLCMVTVGALLLILLHKIWFRGELISVASLSFIKSRQVMVASIIFIVIDLIASAMGIIDVGFAMPTLLAVFSAIQAAVTEETIFRLLPISTMMRTYKDKNSYMVALLLPAIIFGFYHAINLAAGADLTGTIFQIASAIPAGLLFGALYLRTGSIVLPMVIHFLHDLWTKFQVSLQGEGLVTGISTMDIVSAVIIAVACIVSSVWLCKGHTEDIMNTWQGVWDSK